MCKMICNVCVRRYAVICCVQIIEAIYESIDIHDTDALNKAQVRDFLRALHLHYR